MFGWLLEELGDECLIISFKLVLNILLDLIQLFYAQLAYLLLHVEEPPSVYLKTDYGVLLEFLAFLADPVAGVSGD